MTKFAIAAIGALLLALPAQAQMFDDLSPEDRAALHAEIQAYLLENPEILETMVALLNDQREAQQAEEDRLILSQNRDALFNDGVSGEHGNPDGDIVIVEFLDYQCSYCKRAHPEVAELLESDGNIRLIQKEFPILGPASLEASKAALAVLLNEGEDAYAKVSDALMAFDGPLNAATIKGIARNAGADVATMLITAEGPEVAAIIEQNQELGRRLNISGTPSFVFEDRLIRGYIPLASMQELVEQIRGES